MSLGRFRFMGSNLPQCFQCVGVGCRLSRRKQRIEEHFDTTYGQIYADWIETTVGRIEAALEGLSVRHGTEYPAHWCLTELAVKIMFSQLQLWGTMSG